MSTWKLWCLARGLAVAALAALLACGATADEVRTAHEARYNVDFAKLWNVISEETHRRYVGIHIDDPSHGILETDFRVVQSLEQDVGATSNAQATGQTSSSSMSYNPAASSTTNPQRPMNSYTSDVAIFRMTVLVQGPPWKVVVDGVAAKYDPSSPVPVPYHHGSIDEPPWVAQRIDNLTIAIYDRLKQYAVKDVKVEKAERATDVSAWQNLSDRALTEIIGKVRKAATDRDMTGLRSFMVADFRFAEGADTSADTAIAIWSADPTSMRQLARTLDAGCAPDAKKQGDVVCPSKATDEAVTVRFRQVGATWKLVEFLR
jgi:hypothetical protein